MTTTEEETAEADNTPPPAVDDDAQSWYGDDDADADAEYVMPTYNHTQEISVDMCANVKVTPLMAALDKIKPDERLKFEKGVPDEKDYKHTGDCTVVHRIAGVPISALVDCGSPMSHVNPKDLETIMETNGWTPMDVAARATEPFAQACRPFGSRHCHNADGVQIQDRGHRQGSGICDVHGDGHRVCADAARDTGNERTGLPSARPGRQQPVGWKSRQALCGSGGVSARARR